MNSKVTNGPATQPSVAAALAAAALDAPATAVAAKPIAAPAAAVSKPTTEMPIAIKAVASVAAVASAVAAPAAPAMAPKAAAKPIAAPSAAVSNPTTQMPIAVKAVASAAAAASKERVCVGRIGSGLIDGLQDIEYEPRGNKTILTNEKDRSKSLVIENDDMYDIYMNPDGSLEKVWIAADDGLRNFG